MAYQRFTDSTGTFNPSTDLSALDLIWIASGHTQEINRLLAGLLSRREWKHCVHTAAQITKRDLYFPGLKITLSMFWTYLEISCESLRFMTVFMLSSCSCSAPNLAISYQPAMEAEETLDQLQGRSLTLLFCHIMVCPSFIDRMGEWLARSYLILQLTKLQTPHLSA